MNDIKKIPDLSIELVVTVSGNCFPETITEFQQIVDNMINSYNNINKNVITFIYNIQYINSTCMRLTTEIIEYLEEQHKKGIKVQINWFVEKDDEIMIERAEDIKSFTGFEFNIIIQPNYQT
jgi:predicted deacetylase